MGKLIQYSDQKKLVLRWHEVEFQKGAMEAEDKLF